MAADAATWLTAAWCGNGDAGTRSAFYANRFNEIMAWRLQAPYWRALDLESDKTGVSYPELLPFEGAINPAYSDPLRQPTDCRYSKYDRAYPTPTYPSFGTDKSPGWQGEIQNGEFVDLWHATRILTCTIPTAQQTTTRRPIGIGMEITIEATATIRGNTTWFVPITVARVQNQGWNPVSEGKTPTHYRPAWSGPSRLPGDSPGGWGHETTITAHRYGSWRWLESQQTSGSIVVIEIATTPSLGRYYSRNDYVTVTHDELVTAWWPQGPGEM